MLLNARPGPGSPDDFMNAFQTRGWFVRVSFGENLLTACKFKGGDAARARSAMAEVAALPAPPDGAELRHRWVDVPPNSRAGDAALVFRKPLPEGGEISGSTILNKDDFRRSNSRNELDVLVPVSEYFVALAQNRVLMSEIELFGYFANSVSLSMVIVSRMGCVIAQTGCGISFLSDALGVPMCDDNALQRKIEHILSKFESDPERSSPGRRRKQGEAGKAVGDPAQLPYRILRMEPEDDGGLDGSPYYAIVEAKEIELPDTVTLCDRYELTPAEARVVGCMMEGAAVPTISKDLHLTDHTVRTYLKRSYNKIGVSGQAQMISKLTRLGCSLGRLPGPATP